MYDVRGKRMRDGALSGEPWEIPGAPLSNGADPEKGGAVRLVGMWLWWLHLVIAIYTLHTIL